MHGALNISWIPLVICLVFHNHSVLLRVGSGLVPDAYLLLYLLPYGTETACLDFLHIFERFLGHGVVGLIVGKAQEEKFWIGKVMRPQCQESMASLVWRSLWNRLAEEGWMNDEDLRDLPGRMCSIV